MRVDLDKAINEAKSNKRLAPLLGKGIFEMVERQLKNNEEIKYLISVNAGNITKSEAIRVEPFSMSNKTPGILVITTKRILHCSKIMFNTKVEQISIENINNLESRGTILASVLRIQSMTNTMEIDLSAKEVEKISNIIYDLMESSKSSPVPSTTTVDDPIGKIEKLKELKEKGVLTEEEFQKKKEELLDKI